MTGVMWRGFGRVVLAVRDVRAATAVYAELLGREAKQPGVFELGNARIQLRTGPEPEPEPEPESGSDPEPPDDPWGPLIAQRLCSRGEGVFGISLVADAPWQARKLLEECGFGEGAREAATDASAPALRSLYLDERCTEGVPIAVDLDAQPGDAAVGGAGLGDTALRDIGLHESGPPDIAPSDRDRGDAEIEAGAAAAPSDAACVRGVDHVVIRTRAPERAIRLYRDRLGIRLALDRTFPERGVRLIFFRVGGVTLELATRATPPADAREDAGPDFLWGVAYQVADPRSAHARLDALGFELSPVRRGNKAGTEVFTVRGTPLGVPTLIIGPELGLGASAPDQEG